jgi:imidazolonepropionase
MPVLGDIGLLATCAPAGGQGEVHAVPRAALAWEDETLRWVGPEAELPAELRRWERWEAGGRLVVPGLVDCHTHLVFGGWRAAEFERRLRGESALELAASGGGIAATVAATRALAGEALFARAAGFLEEMARLGVTTVEAKSGYGLDVETELRLLRVHRRLGRETPLRVVSTYLGAHVLPPERRGDREAYLAMVSDEMMPRVAREGLAEFADAWVDEGAFSAAEGRRVLAAARAAGLGVKVHADQLSTCGAPSWPPRSAPPRRTTWSASRRRGSPRWPGPAPSP